MHRKRICLNGLRADIIFWIMLEHYAGRICSPVRMTRQSLIYSSRQFLHHWFSVVYATMSLQTQPQLYQDDCCIRVKSIDVDIWNCRVDLSTCGTEKLQP